MKIILQSALTLLAFIAFMLYAVSAGVAQAPAATVLIGPEGITITTTTGTAVAYEFGVGAKLNQIASLPLPALISCATASSAACKALGGDPAPNVAKSLYAVEQAQPYTVTYTAAGSTTPVVVNVPGTAPPVPTVPTVTQMLTCPSVTYTPTVYVLSNGQTLVTTPAIALANCVVTP